MEIGEVRQAEAAIMALEEEMAGYKVEMKRCKEDIAAWRLTTRRRLMNPNQMEIEVPGPKAVRDQGSRAITQP